MSFLNLDEAEAQKSKIKEKSDAKSFRFSILVAAFTLVFGGGLFYYFIQPKHEQQVRAPSGLEDAIKKHFVEKEKRAVESIIYYNCERVQIGETIGEKHAYSARVKLTPSSDLINYALDGDYGWQVFAFPKGNEWEIIPFRGKNYELDKPCVRK